MTELDDLIRQIFEHKGYFWPENDPQVYIGYVFRYCDEYLRQSHESGKDGMLMNMIHYYVKSDLDEIKQNYYDTDRPGGIYIPPFEAIPDIVEWDIEHKDDPDEETIEA